MQSLSRFLNDAQMAWLTSSINCCAAREDVGSCEPEKSMRIVNGQPQLISPPLPQPLERPQTASSLERPQTRGKEWTTSRSRTSSRGSFGLRRNLSSRASNRMVISAPYNFQHHTETSFVREPERVVIRNEPNLRPLELSIYLPGNRLSPLPEFGPHTYDERNDRTLLHMRSESALEFKVPRKPVLSTVVERKSMNGEELLDALANDSPPQERPTRLRANTEPPAYERIKSALLENIELDKRLKELDEAIERRSIYLASRPTSRASRAEIRQERRESIYSEFTELMPAITDLPPHNTNRRPQTAPSRPRRLKSLDSSLRAPKLLRERPLPPPLPLVLQTPQVAARSKSLSRVSSWLFPSEQHHSRHMSLDSVTNTPKPVTSRQGFYQCIEVKEVDNPLSVSSVSSIASENDGNEDYEATSWSESPSLGHGDREVNGLGYGVRISVDSKRLQVAPPSRDGARTFGGSEKSEEARWSMAYGYGRESVGVAF